jgi:HAMP domain-containing protein
VTPRTRIAIVAAAVVALVVAFVIASGSGGDEDTTSGSAQTTAQQAPAGTTTAPEATTTTPEATTTTPPQAPATPVVRVVGAKPQGGVQKLSSAKGDTVRFTVRSDTADEIHVHGYDLKKDVAAGGSVTFSFPAKIDGRFEVELENHGEQIAELEVTP